MEKIKCFLKNFFTVIGFVFLTSFIFAICYSIGLKDDLSYLLTYLIMIIFFIFFYKKTLLLELKNLKNDIKGNIPKITIFCISIIVLMYIANIILYNITGNIANNEEIVRKTFFESPILMGINIILLGPIVEELTYRYPFKNDKYPRLLIYIFYSSLFALTHISNITTLTEALFFIPYLLLSLCFGYGFYKTNNIFVSIIIHIMNNLVNIVLLLI